mmetsp:Transcript_6044/g.22107  ORF Transcript_6044/g.22107 Transcript_6044/m.22107 type:complete len:212 (+) Transcript_6044:1211-1846(+)
MREQAPVDSKEESSEGGGVRARRRRRARRCRRREEERPASTGRRELAVLRSRHERESRGGADGDRATEADTPETVRQGSPAVPRRRGVGRRARDGPPRGDCRRRGGDRRQRRDARGVVQPRRGETRPGAAVHRAADREPAAHAAARGRRGEGFGRIRRRGWRVARGGRRVAIDSRTRRGDAEASGRVGESERDRRAAVGRGASRGVRVARC